MPSPSRVARRRRAAGPARRAACPRRAGPPSAGGSGRGSRTSRPPRPRSAGPSGPRPRWRAPSRRPPRRLRSCARPARSRSRCVDLDRRAAPTRSSRSCSRAPGPGSAAGAIGRAGLGVQRLLERVGDVAAGVAGAAAHLQADEHARRPCADQRRPGHRQDGGERHLGGPLGRGSAARSRPARSRASPPSRTRRPGPRTAARRRPRRPPPPPGRGRPCSGGRSRTGRARGRRRRGSRRPLRRVLAVRRRVALLPISTRSRGQ